MTDEKTKDATVHSMPVEPEKNSVVQANPLIEARYKLDLLPQLLLRMLISMIKPEHSLFEKKFYQINIAEFGKLIGYKGGSLYPNLLSAARKLMKTLVVIPRLDKNGKVKILETQWMTATIHHSNSGTIEFEFSHHLVPFLLKLKQEFTQYPLKNIYKLRSQYSIRIYELLKQYANFGKRVIPLEKLKEIVGIGNKYSGSADIRVKILLPSNTDINEKTDLSYRWRPIKTGRKVTAIEFYDITVKPTSKETLNDIQVPARDMKALIAAISDQKSVKHQGRRRHF